MCVCVFIIVLLFWMLKVQSFCGVIDFCGMERKSLILVNFVPIVLELFCSEIVMCFKALKFYSIPVCSIS